jgi:phage host-nuclease inhibitor protein Gam
MTTRTRITTPLIRTREEADALLGDLAALELERRRLTTELDGIITAAREHYEAPFAALGGQIDAKQALLHAWADANRAEFGTRKSLDMTHGVVGFRLGTPKAKTLLRKPWAAVLDTIKAFGLLEYVRTKEEVNKEALIADYQQRNIGDDTLKKLGIQIAQEESFFVELRLTEQPRREVVAS